MDYQELIRGIEQGLLKMKDSNISTQDFLERLERFKNFDFRKLSDDEIFWRLTYVMFFNIGKKASMIEKKLPILKKYLFGYKQLCALSDSEMEHIAKITGFRLQVYRCRENAKKFARITTQYGSFQKYLEEAFGIQDINCSSQQIQRLYEDLIAIFQGTGIGETARWHFITELGLYSLKPDSVIKRIFYRLGLISEEQSNSETIEVGRYISSQVNLPIRYIDIIFVKFGQDGKSNLLGTIDGTCLSNNPKCNICTVSQLCNYFPDYKVGKTNNISEEKNNEIDLCTPAKTSSIVIRPIVNNNSKELFGPEEFLKSHYYSGYSSKCKELIQDLFQKVLQTNIKFFVDKRKNNDFVLVAATRINAKTKKNILTVWTYNTSIDIRIMPEAVQHYREVTDFNNIFLNKIRTKYLEII